MKTFWKKNTNILTQSNNNRNSGKTKPTYFGKKKKKKRKKKITYQTRYTIKMTEIIEPLSFMDIITLIDKSKE